jgi:hypothetical protein
MNRSYANGWFVAQGAFLVHFDWCFGFSTHDVLDFVPEHFCLTVRNLISELYLRKTLVLWVTRYGWCSAHFSR